MPPILPQDIPLEASETANFTPPSLKDIAGAPSFVLRSPTKRDERHHRRLMREEGLVTHGDEAMRAEIFVALEHLWSPEDFADHEPRVRAYYAALDEFALQKRDDDTIEWQYDAVEEEAVRTVVNEATRTWAKLRRMVADNLEANDLRAPIIAAIVIDSWTGLDVKRKLDRGYVSVETAQNLIEALEALENKHGLDAGKAGLELFVACLNRLYLTEVELGNSESSPPSPTPPASSSDTAASGKSPKSGRSRKTPATV